MFGIDNRDESSYRREQYWREYEVRYGETVYAYGMGRYISGWAEFQDTLWGLLVATSGGCRFHHFPHNGCIRNCSCIGFSTDAHKEKTLFIPHEHILDVNLWIEKSWWKRFFCSPIPRVLIRYRPGGAAAGGGDPDGQEPAGDTLVIESDRNTAEIIRRLDKQARLKSSGESVCT